MTFARLVALALFPALAGCMTVPPQPPLGPSYYVMRHLHTTPGIEDPDLLPEGRAAAERLVPWFAGDPPAVIYVSTTKRAQQTAAALAAHLGITPKLYDPKDTPALAARVMAETGTVLVVGHSNTVQDIVEALGGARPAPITLADFGDIWHITGIDRQVMTLHLD